MIFMRVLGIFSVKAKKNDGVEMNRRVDPWWKYTMANHYMWPSADWCGKAKQNERNQMQCIAQCSGELIACRTITQQVD